MDDLRELVELHHTSSVDGMASDKKLEGDVVCKGIDDSFKRVYIPTFLSKSYVFNDITP